MICKFRPVAYSLTQFQMTLASSTSFLSSMHIPKRPMGDISRGRKIKLHASQGLPETHLLGLGLIVGVVPLLGLLRGGGNLPGRLAERLGLGLRRHGDSLSG